MSMTFATDVVIDSSHNLSIQGSPKLYYGSCTTAAATVEKAVTCANFTLETGAMIFVTFSATNSGAAANIKLNVNSTGAKNIKKIYNGAVNNLAAAAELQANIPLLFTYNGTYWVLISSADYNSTYSFKEAASGGTATSLVTTGEKYIWNNKADTSTATTSADGLMSSSDKTKLDGVETGAEVNDIFVATYGTTTFAEVAAAAQQGKTIVAKKNNGKGLYFLISSTSTTYAFTGVEYNTIDAVCYLLFLSSTNGWSSGDTVQKKLAGRPFQFTCIAAAGNWSSVTPPTQEVTIEHSEIYADSIVVVGVDSSATAEQYEAAAKAQLLCTSQGTGTITLTCYGEEPQVNIPISVLKVG